MTARDLEQEELLAIFYRLAKISSLSTAEEVLENVMREIVDLIDAQDCSVYLLPELINQFDGVLIRRGEHLTIEDTGPEIVVLAAAKNKKLHKLIGHAFYGINEGITGWVYKHGIPLMLDDTSDKIELSRYASDLSRLDPYGETEGLADKNSGYALLAVPLRRGERIFGVIRFLNPRGRSAFTSFHEKIASVIAILVSSAIGNSWLLKEQNNIILRLVEIGSKRDTQDVLREVTHSMNEILKCDHAMFFRNHGNTEFYFEVENGQMRDSQQAFPANSGLIGWIMRTGKPLIIEDVRQFFEKTHLTQELLEMISDGEQVDALDTEIQFDDPIEIEELLPTTFIGLPIMKDRNIYGTLVSYTSYGNGRKRKGPFTRIDLALCTSLSKTVSLVLESEREKKLRTLLTELGFTSNIKELFDKVIRQIPALILAENCSIYEYRTGPQGRLLNLIQTSRTTLTEKSGVPALSYRIGEGKTGFCAQTETTFVVNYFGTSNAQEDIMEEEMTRIHHEHKEDLVDRLLDPSGLQVGIIQLRGGRQLHTSMQNRFHTLAHQIVITPTGLPSAKREFYASHGIPSPWSFAAIPIKSGSRLLGVIVITRTLTQSAFSHEEITLIESIGGRLAAVLGHLRLQEQEKNLLMSLAHEINTPMTGVLAESENLKNELLSRKDVGDLALLATNNLEQVQRLQLLTETIMGVLSENKSKRTFEFINLSVLLEDARELFMVEAAQKGCDILKPKAIGTDLFPEIEMSGFDLGIAIKNIIHNAVKYSFHAARANDKHRYVNIWGLWADSGHQVYKINIQNYGVGISQEEIEKRLIFYAYYRGEKANDRRRTGAGFGLAYARQVIEDMHNGKIEVSSIPSETGEGYLTTFTVYLPALHKSNPNS